MTPVELDAVFNRHFAVPLGEAISFGERLPATGTDHSRCVTAICGQRLVNGRGRSIKRESDPEVPVCERTKRLVEASDHTRPVRLHDHRRGTRLHDVTS